MSQQYWNSTALIHSASMNESLFSQDCNLTSNTTHVMLGVLISYTSGNTCSLKPTSNDKFFDKLFVTMWLTLTEFSPEVCWVTVRWFTLLFLTYIIFPNNVVRNSVTMTSIMMLFIKYNMYSTGSFSSSLSILLSLNQSLFQNKYSLNLQFSVECGIDFLV